MRARVVIGALTIALASIAVHVSAADATTTRCLPHSPTSAADYQLIANGRNASFGVGDITSAVRLPDGRRFFVLGDTAYYDVGADGRAGPIVAFGNNSAWVQSGPCFRLVDRAGAGPRSWVIPPEQDGSVYWPGAAVVVGTRLHVFFTRLFLDSFFGRPVGAAVATFDLPSLQLARVSKIPFVANRIFGGGAVYDGGYLYTYASQPRSCELCFTRDMYVARVPESQVQIPSAWRYRSASGWVASPTAATPVLRAAVGNTDVQPYGNGFLLITKTFGLVGPQVEAWFAPDPDGPWQDLGTVLSVPDPPPSFVPGFHYTKSFTYNAVALASTRLGDGGFLGSYDVNTFDPSEARRDGRMVGPRFVSIPIPPPPVVPPRPVVVPGPSPWTPTFAVDRTGLVRTVNGGVAFGRSYTSQAVAVARTRTARGGWVAASDGGVFAFGDAQFHGSTGAIRLNQPIVGMAATPTGNGYWLVARDGGVFAFGDAQFYGSTGAIRLNQPIVGMAATPTGNGYWLVARDGGVFAFGDARFHGSPAGRPPPSPVVGLAATPDGLGYWLVTGAGQVYAYAGATYAGNSPSSAPTVGIVTAPGGYRLVDSTGNVFTRGAAPGVSRIPSPTPLVAAG